MLCHKASFGKLKKTEFISSIFSDHNNAGLEINYWKKTAKKHKHMEAKQSMHHWGNQRGNKKYLETNENER